MGSASPENGPLLRGLEWVVVVGWPQTKKVVGPQTPVLLSQLSWPRWRRGLDIALFSTSNLGPASSLGAHDADRHRSPTGHSAAKAGDNLLLRSADGDRAPDAAQPQLRDNIPRSRGGLATATSAAFTTTVTTTVTRGACADSVLPTRPGTVVRVCRGAGRADCPIRIRCEMRQRNSRCRAAALARGRCQVCWFSRR